MEFHGLSQEASTQGALTQGVPRESPADSPLRASPDKGGELGGGAWRLAGARALCVGTARGSGEPERE